ncbi:Subtilase family protein [Bradyrhizobium sp. Gha]|nr:Subtilase family protein [Bradyrhizobium sp. Gha]
MAMKAKSKAKAPRSKTKAAKAPAKQTAPKRVTAAKKRAAPGKSAFSRDNGEAFFAFRAGPQFAAAMESFASSPAGRGLAAATALSLADPSPKLSSNELKTRLSAVANRKLSDFKPLKVTITTPMDPRLQLALANYRMGKRGPELAATAGDEVAVIARVRSVDDWTALPDVDPGAVLGQSEDGSSIVTGRLPVKRLEAVRSEKNILSLKASQPLHPSLTATIPAMKVSDVALPHGTSPDGGKGVVIGIVDFGCDFAHQNFRQSNGKTRLLAIWNQGATTWPGGTVKYGRAYSRAEIDAALSAPNPYAALGYAPPAEPGGTHGTHVMDIATGNGNGTKQAGVAPKADIVFVEASTTNIAWMSPETANHAFGDSVQLLEAVRFVFDQAADRPCVVNLSLGTNGGPHDGTSLVEQGLDAIVREKPNRAVVIAAGNAQTDGIHTTGTVRSDAEHLIEIKQQSEGGAELQIWYQGGRRLRVSVVAPDGSVFGPVEPGGNLTIGAPNQIAIFIGSRLTDPNNADNVVGIWIAEGLSEDNFIVKLETVDSEAVEYHAWLERDDRRQASFMSPVPSHSLGSISTGHHSVVVGSYDAHKANFPISTFSSSGPTRDNRQKPELSAPGQFVIAAKSGSTNGVTKKSGTSMAAPAVTGLIALVYSEAKRKGQDLAISELRDRLLSTATVAPAMQPGAWHCVYGYGRATGDAVAGPILAATAASNGS